MKLILENWNNFLNEQSFEKYSGPEARSEKDFEADRDFKRNWNSKADHDFFKNDVTKIHFVGAFAKNLKGRAKVLPTPELLTNLQNFIKSGNSKNELSAVGYYKQTPSKGGSLSPIGVIIDGRTTFASSTDASTEFTSKATPQDKQKFSSSGLPKRPAVSLGLDPNLMYGAETFSEPVNSHNELIVDNWKPIGIIINTNWEELRYGSYFSPYAQKILTGKTVRGSDFREQEFKDILKYAKTLNLPVYNFNMEKI